MNAVAEILKRAQDEQLPFLLVGGHAVILYQVPRFTRDVDFVVPDEATERWVDFLQRFSYRVYHRTDAFIQLEPATPGTLPPVDLMLVAPGQSCHGKPSSAMLATECYCQCLIPGISSR